MAAFSTPGGFGNAIGGEKGAWTRRHEVCVRSFPPTRWFSFFSSPSPIHRFSSCVLFYSRFPSVCNTCFRYPKGEGRVRARNTDQRIMTGSRQTSVSEGIRSRNAQFYHLPRPQSGDDKTVCYKHKGATRATDFA